MTPNSSDLPIRPGFVVGIAVAGFFDGVFLHQVLQWHHMICIETHCVATSVASLKRQTFTDGVFHAVMFVVLLVGLAMLTSALANGGRMVQRRFWGALLFGAGVFNVIEGIVDHHILQIHHVRFGPMQTPLDLGFLGVSAVIGVIGWRMTRATASTVRT